MKDDILDLLGALAALACALLLTFTICETLDRVDSLEADAAALAKLPTVTRGGGQ